ncbi:patched domain-containing protein 3-like isoform X2 [Varroa jacobsoni]|uniref:SSD domain-containing protein n=1 Tax=Varroa destructor TaxID=109461 RepID=A0A7M7KNM0_VARDE|nr:patched domain-containing protein 3-like isoform X2 [Varroa destructor]XP_022696702.1 patched domain-containing protein 3-like isoform X2 [Varroa jacobsoni]
MSGVQRDFLERALSNGFQRLGRSLARNPALYISTSFAISLGLFSFVLLPLVPYEPLQRLVPPLKYLDDPEFLFAPVHSRAYEEARIIAASFPTNTSLNFDVGRATRHEAFARVIIEAKNRSVLTGEVWKDVLQLDRLIRALSINTADTSSIGRHRRTYSELCARDNGRCFVNDFLVPLTKMMPMLEFGPLTLDYPLHVITRKNGRSFYIPTGVFFGGANLSEDGSSLRSAQALTLVYYLEAESDASKFRARQWESAFVDLLSEMRLPNVRTYFFTSRSLAAELERNMLSVAPLLPITIVLMLAFTMVSCSMTGGCEWYMAKPWVGFFSCVTVLLSVGAATGCMALAGVPLIGIDLAAPFLMLGIGLDDTFVMLSAWKHTKPSLSVPDRTAQMFGEAGVSITITSITNVISFVIGAYRLTLDDSYAKDFFIADDKYFKSYPYRVQVVFNRPLNYTLAEVAELAPVIEDFESSSYVRNRALTECWFRESANTTRLREYLGVLSRRAKLGSLADYLAPGISIIRKDVRWKNQSIVSSRCMLQARDVRSSNDEAAMMMELREIADRHSAFNVTVFHPLFVFFDQFLLVRSTTAQSVVVATLVMILVTVLLLPSGWAVAWMALTIASIELGVLGFMTLWGVNLDSISMINLIMCIGFSVDYSAHIAHAFLTGRAPTPEGRVAETLSALGVPVVQGALSTLLGIIILAAAPSYIFLTFFKTVFLVIVLGALHALIFLPVFLSATFKQKKEIIENNVV